MCKCVIGILLSSSVVSLYCHLANIRVTRSTSRHHTDSILCLATARNPGHTSSLRRWYQVRNIRLDNSPPSHVECQESHKGLQQVGILRYHISYLNSLIIHHSYILIRLSETRLLLTLASSSSCSSSSVMEATAVVGSCSDRLPRKI